MNTFTRNVPYMNFRQTGTGNVAGQDADHVFRVSPAGGRGGEIKVDIVSLKILCYPAACFEVIASGSLLPPAPSEEASRMMGRDSL